MPPWRAVIVSFRFRRLDVDPLLRVQSIVSFCLTLRRARGAASGVLGDVDSLAVSDVELREELLLDSSLLDGRLVANCRMDERVRYVRIGKLMIIFIID